MSDRIFFVRCAAFVVSVVLCAARPAFPVEPGIDIAAPRVAVSTVDSARAFHPPRLVIEQGDHVRWTVLAAGGHTTLSGLPCVGDGLWNESLGIAGTNYTRLFIESPRTFPYLCSAHCAFGMTGSVVLTTLINLTMTASAGVPMLSWAGGSGSYRVFRSDGPRFIAPNTVTMTPDGGSTGTTLTDLVSPQPEFGRVNYYLVMNLF